MTEPDSPPSEGDSEQPSRDELTAALKEIEGRCKAAALPFEQVRILDVDDFWKLGMKCGRETRWIFLGHERLVDFASVPFEKYTFLSGFDAICSYEDKYIEAGFRHTPITLQPASQMYKRLFGVTQARDDFDVESAKASVESPQDGLPNIEISTRSDVYLKLVMGPLRASRLTLKLTDCAVRTHDQALALLKKTAGALFLQIDLLSDIPFALDRERRTQPPRRPRKTINIRTDITYPKTEFDDAALALYWYGRSASGMPLLQFLAFYQVLEFYFPVYSQAEAQRKIRTILKDPTFRGDRDVDIGRILSAITISRSGGFGDERSQLRATILECITAETLRSFLESDGERKEFYSGKKALFHRIPLSNPTLDLRADVAERLYSIRCKIVHTKNDSGDEEVERLLPFSKEAEQLSFDIELIQFIAQRALVVASLPFRPVS